jgi:hypothetical protein
LNGQMSVAYPISAVSSDHSQGQSQSRGVLAVAPEDGLLATLAPIWQVVIGGCVLLAVVAAAARLARRGRSRMTTALLVTGAAVIGLALIGVLTGRS